LKIHNNPNNHINILDEFIKSLSNVVADMVQERFTELTKVYGNDEDKIFEVLSKEFTNVADIKKFV
jgi:hypothetical protein